MGITGRNKEVVLILLIAFISFFFAEGGCGGSSNSGSSELPASWMNQDIGTGMAEGSATYNNGTYTIRGAGELIPPHQSDQLHFVFQELTGDFTIVARVVSMQGTDPTAMAGLMARDSLDPGSSMVQFWVTPASEGEIDISLGSRSETGGSSSAGMEIDAANFPFSLKLARSGNDFSGWYSSNGVDWTHSHYNDNNGVTTTVDMSGTVYVGMFVLSYDADTLERVKFDRVEITTP